LKDSRQLTLDEEHMASKNLPMGAGTVLQNMHVVNVCEQLEVDPIKFLAEVVKGTIVAETSERISAAKELAAYMHTKQKAVEHRGEINNTLTYQIVNFGSVAPEAAQQLKEHAQAILDNRPKTRAEINAAKRANPVTDMEPVLMIDAMRQDVDNITVGEDGLRVLDEKPWGQ
jgi:hypothetical protein